MANHNPARWNPREVRSVLVDYCPHVLELLDAETRRRGVEPTSSTVDYLLNIGAIVATLATSHRENRTLRQAEGGLTEATPTQVIRALQRARTIMVSPPITDQ